MNATGTTGTDAGDLYLELLKRCLMRSLFPADDLREVRVHGWHKRLWDLYIASDRYLGLLRRPRAMRGAHEAHEGTGDGSTRRLGNRDWRLAARAPVSSAEDRDEGRSVPADGSETMVGRFRLENIQQCVESVIADNIPGDLIETGVWRGGAAIFMRAVLAARGISDRDVWLADSFEGLPSSNPERYPGDEGINLSGVPTLAVNVEEVKANFERYELLDDKVRFLVGWFKDTLPGAPIDELAVVRLDGDLYESTIDAITALYPKLSVGGYLIVDDYAAPKLAKACGQAIRDYRAEHNITEPIQQIDWSGAYWRRET